MQKLGKAFAVCRILLMFRIFLPYDASRTSFGDMLFEELRD
jgi:hypothetical protein